MFGGNWSPPSTSLWFGSSATWSVGAAHCSLFIQGVTWSISLPEPAADFREISGKTTSFFSRVVLMLNWDIVPSLKFVRVR